jgi:hypothetical protein
MNKFYVIRLSACLLFSSYCSAQTPVNSVSTVTSISVPGGSSSQVITSHPNAVNSIQENTNYTVSYNNNGNVNINSFTISGKTYVKYGLFDTIILRRVANTWETTGGNKQQIYCEGPLLVDNLFHTMNFPVAFPQVTNHAYMQRVMKEGYINRGSDNVFNNDPNSDQTSNNIERVDFVTIDAVASNYTNLAGFLIAERGGNDPFKIAAITGIDANGNPTSFGSVLAVNTSSYGSIISSAATYVMRKDAADNVLRPFSQVTTQGIRSVFISFSNLGITANQKIYGYSLMAADVTATTSAQLLNFSNSTYFPRTTTTANGGMDLASAPGIYHTDLVLAGHYLTLGVVSRNCSQSLQWNDKEAADTKEYQVERSYDGEQFERIGSLTAAAKMDYAFTDMDQQKTASYYRLKVIMRTGVTYYSSVVFASKNCNAEKVSIYPNPVQDRTTISMNYKVTEITIYGTNGKEVSKWALTGNEQQVKLDLSHLTRGQYFVSLKDASGVQKSYPVIKL